MPELPEVETIRRQLAPLVEGSALRAVEVLDPRWSRPLAPRGARRRAAGPARRALGRRGKYLLWSFDGRRAPGAAPAHDRRGAVPTPSPSRRTRACASSSGPRAGAARGREQRAVRLVIVDPRRFGTGELLPAPRRSRRSSRASRPRAVRRALHRRAPARAGARAHARRSRRCCSTSAGSPAWATSTPTRRCSARASTRAPGRDGSSREQHARLREGVIEALERGHRRARREHRRLPPRRRRARRLPGPVPRAPARGRAVRAVRDDDRQDGRCRARHVRVRDLPAPATARAPGGQARLASPNGRRSSSSQARRCRRRPAPRRSRRAAARRRAPAGRSSCPSAARAPAARGVLGRG